MSFTSVTDTIPVDNAERRRLAMRSSERLGDVAGLKMVQGFCAFFAMLVFRFPAGISRLVCLFILAILPATVRGESSVYTTSDGVVLLSNNPGCYFTLDIPGRSIRPAGMDSAPNPMLSVDGKFLQVISVPGDEFHAKPKMSDEEFLRSHLAYEAGHHKIAVSDIKVEAISLVKGRKALLWSFTPPIPNPKEQVFLAFRSQDYVIVLGSAIDPPQTRKEIRAFLNKIANSFYRSAKQMTLEFARDGTYKRKTR